MVATYSAAGPPHIGSYEVIGRLADGRETIIWAASYRRPGGFRRRVAIKCLRSELNATSERCEALWWEASIGAALDHPTLVQTIDAGTWNGRPYLVTELVRGWSLRSVLATTELTRIPVPLAAALSIVHGAAEAAHYLHELLDHDGRPLGLTHRAIDDTNVMLGRAGFTKLIDFGLTVPTARGKPEPIVGRQITRFTAPESLGHRAIDRRADVFSLGVLLEVLAEHLAMSSADDLVAVIRRATAQNPRDRFMNARDFQRSIEAVAMARDIPLSTTAAERFLDYLFSPSSRPASMPGLAEANQTARRRVAPNGGRTRVRITRGGPSQVSTLRYPPYKRRRATTGC